MTRLGWMTDGGVPPTHTATHRQTAVEMDKAARVSKNRRFVAVSGTLDAPAHPPAYAYAEMLMPMPMPVSMLMLSRSCAPNAHTGLSRGVFEKRCMPLL